LVAPGILLLGPLAGLLLVARPVSRHAWATIALAVTWCGLWLAQLGDLTGQFLRAYSVVLIGAWVVVVPQRPRQPLRQASLAIAVAGGVTLGWLYALGFRWGDLEAAAARSLSTGLLAQARMAQGLGNDAGQQLRTALYEAAGQARQVAQLLPAGLILASLSGLALAWRGHFPLASQALGPPPRAFTAFTFSDQAVWLVVLSLGALLLPGSEHVPGLDLVARNVLVVMLSLYAVRGAAIFRASTGRPSALGVALYSVLAVLMFAFVASGLTVLGLADTWLDFRRRLAASSPGGTK
jgi:hypothetical protein